MSISPKIEAYLLELDRALGPIALSERADIVTEIKSHLLESMEREPERSVESLLEALGEPAHVANRYLMERGLQPSRPPKRPIWKWLVIGMLGTMTLAMVTLLILVWKFSPLIHVDEKEDRVALLGGMIDINGKKGSVKIGNVVTDMGSELVIEGSHDVKNPADFKVELPFTNGKIELLNAAGNTLMWECKIRSAEAKEPKITKEARRVALDFSQVHGVKCEVQVPAKSTVKIEGGNGKLEVERPRFHLDAKLSNGKVELVPDDNLKYKFTTKVTNGKMDDFTSSEDKGALRMDVTIANGVISRD